MIINNHTHMSRYGVDFSPRLGEFYAYEMFAGAPCWYTGEPWKPEDFCVPVDRLIFDMDRLGIDKAVVLGIAYKPMDSYDPDSAEYVEGMVKKYPERLIGFYTADPLGGRDEVKRFEKAVQEHGLRGLKMLPSYNYAALNDRRIWPLYEAAEALGVPAMLHTGWSSLPKGKMLQYDHPLYAEDIVLDFPNIKLILAHVGFQWAEEAIHFMAKFPNVYGDVAFWAETTPMWRVAQIWTWAKKLGVLDRIMWGSDYPYVDFNNGLEFFKGVPEFCERHEIGPAVTADDLETFFGGAAARLFGLEPDLQKSAAGHC